MNKDSILAASLARLDALIAAEYRADPPDFAAKAQAIGPALPDELAQTLAGLVAAHASLQAEPDPDDARIADFAFRCGQVHEQLRAHRQIELELEASAQVPPAQAEPLARFIEVRDRLFRQVADFTLKALLVMLGLLTLGLVLGLV
ncbi:hypothetical protein [Methylomagnum ishizawai]|uniref:hypothetical protein n=1 Tax=Methylomagnum ishizawai TaxID=1760988 RepID=UPI001C33FC75|nr:hypothetical protein [Methylomagnum ishizawai]BBL73646.1 hypothetical protein MishRS11D_07440 [Methylomagnum ishizawai]